MNDDINEKSEAVEKNEVIIDHRILAAKLTLTNWMKDVPAVSPIPEVVEVRFKNTRKAFFSNPANIPLVEGDIVAVEAALGHDIGIVSLTGELVKVQMRLKRLDLERNPLKKVYRKAKPTDIEKWEQAIALEHDTMIRSRQLASELNLNMKIGDVEYQGDKTKAIFYYIAEERVDFRQLIKVLADSFRIRIEMKQIGARQEAGRIGGIGPCGRKLCCSTFITNFVSVSTSAARYQDISLNPQKLAGQCGKLKCCLNYELDAYIDGQRDFPSSAIDLNVGDGLLYFQKSDIFKRVMSYCSDREGKGVFINIPVDRVKEIIALNKKGVIPEKAIEQDDDEQKNISYTDGVGEESLNRFDDKKQKRRKSKRRRTNTNEGEGPVQANSEDKKPVESVKTVTPKANNSDAKPRQNKQAQSAKSVKLTSRDNATTNNTTKPKTVVTKQEVSTAVKLEEGENKPKSRNSRRRFNNRGPKKNDSNSNSTQNDNKESK